MFKSIYKKIAEDFAFLNDYGYFFDHNLPHHVTPSVVFKSDKAKLQIGYNSEEDRIYVGRYVPADAWNSIDFLSDVYLIGRSYKDQVGQVRERLLEHLMKGNI